MRLSMDVIDGKDFRRMIAGAYGAFMREHEYINSLNVFPVPDGDTGTNMLLTLGAVAKAVTEAPDGGIGSLARRGADSAIMGARGNSGVILSRTAAGDCPRPGGQGHGHRRRSRQSFSVWNFVCLPGGSQAGRRHYSDGGQGNCQGDTPGSTGLCGFCRYFIRGHPRR